MLHRELFRQLATGDRQTVHLMDPKDPSGDVIFRWDGERKTYTVEARRPIYEDAGREAVTEFMQVEVDEWLHRTD